MIVRLQNNVAAFAGNFIRYWVLSVGDHQISVTSVGVTPGFPRDVSVARDGVGDVAVARDGVGDVSVARDGVASGTMAPTKAADP